MMKVTNRFKKHLITFNLMLVSACFVACEEQNKHKTSNRNNPKLQEPITKETDTHLPNKNPISFDNKIRSIYQDKHGNFWFGSNDAGLYYYDGKNVIQYINKDGLANNQVQIIKEDKLGNIWIGNGGFKISRFDGKTFTTFTDKATMNLTQNLISLSKNTIDDLWFPAGAGVFGYNGKKIDYFRFDSANLVAKKSSNDPFQLGPFSVYSILKDKKGNLWFGTQSQGVCCYDGKSFKWYTEKGLSGSAVLALFEDSKGNIWFGNNGAGLFKLYDNTLINFTEEHKLSNPEFKISGKDTPGTLARIYAINEDKDGKLWIGTVDAGVWRLDGNNFTNFTTQNGLSSNAINTIYKDKNADLWFGTDSNGICKFNGNNFYQFEIN